MFNARESDNHEGQGSASLISIGTIKTVDVPLSFYLLVRLLEVFPLEIEGKAVTLRGPKMDFDMCLHVSI